MTLSVREHDQPSQLFSHIICKPVSWQKKKKKKKMSKVLQVKEIKEIRSDA